MKAYDVIDGGHRITVAKEKGFPKTLTCNIFSNGRDGHIASEVRDLPVSVLVLNPAINPRSAELDPGTLNKLRKGWDPAGINTIAVREVGGSLTDKVANFLFELLNEQRAVHFFHKFASRVGQHDPDALGILAILDKHELRLSVRLTRCGAFTAAIGNRKNRSYLKAPWLL